MQLNGRVVLLTGASRGLGRALALELAGRGARIACVARGTEALEATVEDLAARGGHARAYPFDLTRVEECDDLVARVEADLGPASVLICNAAMATVGEVADCDVSEYERHLRGNVLASIALTRALLPGMTERRSGTFAYVLSALALRSLPAFSTYAVAKSALRGFAESLRVELADTPVRVLTVMPGTLKTEGLAHLDRVGESPRILESGFAAPPERVARRVVRAIERNRDRVTVRGPSWWAQQLDHFAPSLVTKILARAYRRD